MRHHWIMLALLLATPACASGGSGVPDVAQVHAASGEVETPDAQQVGQAQWLPFGRDSAMLSTPVRQQLDAASRRLLAEPRLRLQVQARARAGEADPQALAQRRADIVLRWLASNGVDRARVEPAAADIAADASGVELRWAQP